MSQRKHVHEETFPVSCERLFRILHTPSAIRAWWGAASAIVLPEEGGTWTAAWGEEEDAPHYVTSARMSVFDPPRRIVFTDYRYVAKDGPLPFDAEFVTEFLVRASEGGATLRVIQDGFPEGPEADEFYEGCRVGWVQTFEGIRDFLGNG